MLPFVDELGSGVAPATVPDLARDLALPPGIAAGAIITAFHALALVIEAPLLAWADRERVRFVSSASLAALALVLVLAAIAPSSAWLFVALALYGPASGVALAAAEGVLVESRPQEREKTMTRLTLAGVAGDLAVPLLLGLLTKVGLGWRTELGVCAAVALTLAIATARSRSLDMPMATEHDDDRSPPLRELLRVLRKTPALVGWSLAGVAIGLLDEVLVAFATVHLAAYADAASRAGAILAWTLGGAVGLFLLERALTRVRPLLVLSVSSLVCAIALTGFALAKTPLFAGAALALVGFSSSMFHPIAKARAYAALPGRPALVNAVASLLLPLDAILPLALGAISTHWGSRAAILALLVAPLAVATLSARARTTRASRPQH